jgi:hypothetical protein
VSRDARHLHNDGAVVLTNPAEDFSPATVRAVLDEVLAGPEPELESIGAVEALRASRPDSAA